MTSSFLKSSVHTKTKARAFSNAPFLGQISVEGRPLEANLRFQFPPARPDSRRFIDQIYLLCFSFDKRPYQS